jgi:hypothetical protein
VAVRGPAKPLARSSAEVAAGRSRENGAVTVRIDREGPPDARLIADRWRGQPFRADRRPLAHIVRPIVSLTDGEGGRRPDDLDDGGRPDGLTDGGRIVRHDDDPPDGVDDGH